ncbi:MAG: hypothetical protein WCX32_03915 [Clostridia bacterium]|jgi:hypothetical protein|nr:hypothetical protein [Clostridia bacterium]MDD4275506.1 hypothetical protein [Clostridia bacterium]
MIPKQDLVVIKNFCNSCDDMVNGKFILVDVKISKVLKCVAACPTLYKLMESCLRGVDLVSEFSKAIVGSPVRKMIKLPENNKKVIALILGLLIEIDKKNIDLHTFLHEYYHSIDGSSSEYANFSKSMILPFKLAVLNELDLEEDFAPEKYIAQQVESKAEGVQTNLENENYIDADKKFETIKELANIIIKQASQEPKIKVEKLEELKIVLDAMIEGANYQSIKVISALWLAYTSIIKNVKSLQSVSDKLREAIANIYQ